MNEAKQKPVAWPEAPKEIYLVVCGDDDCDLPFREHGEVTWCEDRIHATDIRYVRADTHPAPEAKQEALLDSTVPPHALYYPLSDYHRAPAEGPLNFTWIDKPHRLLYDLIAAVKFYANPAPSVTVKQGEPDGWRHKRDGHVQWRTEHMPQEVCNKYTNNGQWEPLYTHPAPSVTVKQGEPVKKKIDYRAECWPESPHYKPAPVAKQEPVAWGTEVKYGKLFFRIGVQSFAIDYTPEDEPDCSAGNAMAWMEKRLREALSKLAHPAPEAKQEPVGKFAKFTDGVWREVTDGSPGVFLYELENTK